MTDMNLSHLLRLLSCLAVVLFASSAQADSETTLILQFGINSTDSPMVVGQKFLPVLKRFESELEKRLNQPVRINFRVFRTYDQTVDAFVSGEVDFGRLGPASYVHAKRRNPKIRLLAMENRKGKRTFNGFIIVAADSPIKKLSDLKGRTFAFGNEISTIGRYLAQQELRKVGVCANDLNKYEYLGRHDNVYNAVKLGRFDAGALKESTVHKRNQKQEIRVLHHFPNVTKPWLARADMDNEIFTALQAVMLGLKSEAAFKKLKIEGFFSTSHASYKTVEEAMDQVDAFEGSCS